MDQEKYIFFYGGEYTKWIEQFEESVSAIQEEISSIVRLRMEKGSEGEDILRKFWNRIESFPRLELNIELFTLWGWYENRIIHCDVNNP